MNDDGNCTVLGFDSNKKRISHSSFWAKFFTIITAGGEGKFDRVCVANFMQLDSLHYVNVYSMFAMVLSAHSGTPVT